MATKPASISGFSAGIQEQLASALSSPEIQESKQARTGPVVQIPKDDGAQPAKRAAKAKPAVPVEKPAGKSKGGQPKGAQDAQAQPAADVDAKDKKPTQRPGKRTGAVPSVLEQQLAKERKELEDTFAKHAEAALQREEGRDQRAFEADETDEDATEPDESAAGEAEASAEDEELEAPEEEEEEEEAEEEDQPAKKGKEMTHAKALQILRLEGWTGPALENLGPDEAMKLASTQVEKRARVARVIAENAALKKQMQAQAEAAADDTETPDAQQQSPATGALPTFDVKAASKRLREGWDEETADAIAEPLTAAVEHVSRYAQELVSAAMAQMTPHLQALGEMQKWALRSQLERVYPELGDEKFFAQALKAYEKLDPAGYGGNLRAMAEDAVIIARGKGTKFKQPSDGSRAARGKAQMTAPTRAGQTKSHRSVHDALPDIIAAIERGDTDEAKRIRREAGV